MRLTLRENGHAVIRLLPMIGAAISSRLQSECRKQFIGAFRLLQADDVRLGLVQPRKQTILSFAKRVDIPRSDAHLL